MEKNQNKNETKRNQILKWNKDPFLTFFPWVIFNLNFFLFRFYFEFLTKSFIFYPHQLYPFQA